MIVNIVKKLFPFEYSICGKGNDEAIKVFKKYLNFKIHSSIVVNHLMAGLYPTLGY